MVSETNLSNISGIYRTRDKGNTELSVISASVSFKSSDLNLGIHMHTCEHTIECVETKATDTAHLVCCVAAAVAAVRYSRVAIYRFHHISLHGPVLCVIRIFIILKSRIFFIFALNE